MDKAELQYEKRDSVEVTRNAEGECGWKIKLYFRSEDDKSDETVWELHDIDRQLREAFL